MVRVLSLGLSLALGSALSLSASAQEARPHDDLNLPSWAEPGQYSPGPGHAPQSSSPPTLPGAPTQMPIDGGLALLAAAGAGYAAHRLRQRPC